MARRGRFLMVLWDGGGNVPPQLSIARRLAAAGHTVRVLGSRSLQKRIEAYGVGFRGFEAGPEWGSHLGRGFSHEYILDVQVGSGILRDVESQLEREAADVLVIDFMMFSTLAAAERSDRPTAALMHTLYQPNREGGPGSLWDQNDIAALNQTRKDLKLKPLQSGRDLFDALGLLLVLTPMAFDHPVAELPANVHYVGPVLDQDSTEQRSKLPWPPDHADPLVLVSFSTTYQKQESVMQRILDALAELPVRGLVTAGPAIDARALKPHANTVVRSYIDHEAVLPQTAVVVTHAGLSTVMAALAHGVPLLCLPMGRDQGVNAERVEACKAGRSLPIDASPEQIRTALRDVLESPDYRRGAQRMAGIIAHEANGSRAVPLLEGLLS